MALLCSDAHRLAPYFFELLCQLLVRVAQLVVGSLELLVLLVELVELVLEVLGVLLLSLPESSLRCSVLRSSTLHKQL